MSISQPVLWFTQLVGTTSAPKKLTVKNNAPTAVTINKIYSSRPAADDFAQTKALDCCSHFGLTPWLNRLFSPAGTLEAEGEYGD